MSALGQKQTFWSSVPVSALPPKADIADGLLSVHEPAHSSAGAISSTGIVDSASSAPLMREEHRRQAGGQARLTRHNGPAWINQVCRWFNDE
jgi:hypothetical protein